jgi:hypothetical protein
VEVHAASGLAVHLLNRCVDPELLENQLAAIDSLLVDRMVRALVPDVDWDEFWK